MSLARLWPLLPVTTALFSLLALFCVTIADDGIREIRSGADFAAAFADPMVTELLINEPGVRISDADWDHFQLPIPVNRNVSSLNASQCSFGERTRLAVSCILGAPHALAQSALARGSSHGPRRWCLAPLAYTCITHGKGLLSPTKEATHHRGILRHRCGHTAACRGPGDGALHHLCKHAHVTEGLNCTDPRPQVTVTGPSPDPRAWPLLDLGGVRDKVGGIQGPQLWRPSSELCRAGRRRAVPVATTAGVRLVATHPMRGPHRSMHTSQASGGRLTPVRISGAHT